MKLVRKPPQEAPSAPEPIPATEVKDDAAERVAEALAAVVEHSRASHDDLALVSKALTEKIGAMTVPGARPTSFRFTVTERDREGRVKAFDIEVK